MAASAGYKGKVSAGGAATAFTGGACTLVSGKTYQLNSSVQRLLDPNTARVWKDGGTPIAASAIASEDLLFGKVTFATFFTPGGAITCDGAYIPKAAVAAVKSAELSEKNDNVDTTPINSNGAHQRTAVLMDASVSITVFDDLSNDLDPNTAGTQSFRYYLENRLPLLVEIDPDGAGTYVWRGWLVSDDGKVSYEPGQVAMGTIGLSLNAQGNALALAGASWGVP